MLIYPDKYLNNVKEITIDFLKENNLFIHNPPDYALY